MKQGIHPEYQQARIVCVCGNVIETRSTIKEIRVEICSNCHPFFTGRQKLVDTAGRVERFRRRYREGEAAATAGEAGATAGEAATAAGEAAATAGEAGAKS